VTRLHAGVDLAARSGTPVLATADGVIAAAEHSGGLGNHVVMVHNIAGRPVASVYGHLLDRSITIHVGDVVTAGQVIGKVGSTGNSTGPHLHFEIRPGGPSSPAIDPTGWLTTAETSGQLDAAVVVTQELCTTGGEA
jgi:murein DD-endopeptidase MepM/ murein hydrolase activator NlpD